MEQILLWKLGSLKLSLSFVSSPHPIVRINASCVLRVFLNDELRQKGPGRQGSLAQKVSGVASFNSTIQCAARQVAIELSVPFLAGKSMQWQYIRGLFASTDSDAPPA